MNTDDQRSPDGKGTLVLLLHAYTHRAASLQSVENAVKDVWPRAITFRPELPASLFSLTDPNRIVIDLLRKIDNVLEKAKADANPINNIVLIGHSLGALIARKLYVVACGETPKAPFEKIFSERNSTTNSHLPWAGNVNRIILLAGMNRGWRVSHHISLWRAPLWALGSVTGYLIRSVTRKWPLIFKIRRGAEFITQLRIQWLRMRQRVAGPPSETRGAVQSPGGALTIQLLGSVDDMVAPEDNVDLVSGGDFLYFDVPYSGHADVIDFDDPRKDSVSGKSFGSYRRERFLFALTASREILDREAVIPSDERFTIPNTEVEKMVFVIHGIRDAGYWTHKIARRIKQRATCQDENGNARSLATWATETSSYGYFPMLPFIFPWYRRQKVEWLMDQYTEALARYPNASISYVGHSNGTYLLAKALDIYPCCQFENVVLAGSVVSQRYKWQDLMGDNNKRVKSILNFVATSDWVVAFFPKVFQMLHLQDLGSLGHDGFGFKPLGRNMYEAEWVRGGHGAAIAEPMWDMIADFVISGHTNTNDFPRKGNKISGPAWLIKLAGYCPLVVWALVGWLVWYGWNCINNIFETSGHNLGFAEYAPGFAASLYILVLCIVLVRV